MSICFPVGYLYQQGLTTNASARFGATTVYMLEKTLLQMPVEGTSCVLHYVAEQFPVNTTWNYYG